MSTLHHTIKGERSYKIPFFISIGVVFVLFCVLSFMTFLVYEKNEDLRRMKVELISQEALNDTIYEEVAKEQRRYDTLTGSINQFFDRASYDCSLEVLDCLDLFGRELEGIW